MIELEHFLQDQLQRLPEEHPDRPFLSAQHDLVTAFLERGNSGEVAVSPPEVETVYDAGSAVEPVTDDEVAIVPGDPLPQPEQAERERIVLKGRMGKRVRYSTTPRGVRRAEFNLGVALDEEHTDWHTVLAFRQRADQLEQAQPHSGQYAEVIGYKDLQERKDRDGNLKQVERIIAACR